LKGDSRQPCSEALLDGAIHELDLVADAEIETPVAACPF
jgi:hypothetical protein